VRSATRGARTLRPRRGPPMRDGAIGTKDFVSEGRGALKETKADVELGIYVVPDVNGLTESFTGQRIKDLAPLVDWIAPMLTTTFCCDRPPGSRRRSLRWSKSPRKGRCRSCKPIRTETRTRVATGDLRYQTPIGAKRFCGLPDGLTLAS
jgi:hypothetical protein